MATSMLLQATPRSVAELPVSSVHRNEMYTMLQAPSIGEVRRFGAGRKGHGVCRRRAVRIGFRAQSGLFTLPGIKKAKKDVSEVIEANVSEGTKKVRKQPGTLKFGKGKKDNKVVFVAGATGKVGSRIVRELLELGFQVQAGVRDVAKGQALLETLDATTSSNDEPKLSWATKLFKPKTPSRGKRVELVECDLENKDEIENSLGNAGVVVCAIGASEKEVLDTTGPYRIDYKATENLIKAATNAKVNHFILVTSLGTTKLGWPASALNLFWGVLIWKAKAEKALEESGLPYTIVRPGGMERPTDAYKETHNLVLAPKDTYFGGQVSSLQVAELIGRCVSNLELAKYKVLEVVAETTAPLRPIEDLLVEIPISIGEDDGGIVSNELVPSSMQKSAKISRQQEEKSKKLAQAEERREKNLRDKSQKAAEEKQKKDLQEKNRKATEAAEKKKKELLARYERDLLVAREEEEEAKRKVDEAISLKAQLVKKTADLQVQARTAAREAKKAKALENAITGAARQAHRLSEKNKREILEAASTKFDSEWKTLPNIEKMLGKEKKTPIASTSYKPKKGLQFKALQAAKLKEAEDKAAKKSTKMDRLAKQEANEKEVKERIKKQENEDKAKMEAETKSQVEKDRITQEENEAKAKREAEAKAKAERDCVSQEENKANAKVEAEEKEKAKIERNRVIQEENKAKAKAEAEAEAKKEALVKKARQAKEDATTRAAIALERAKAATSVGFLWPRQKKSANEKVSSKTSITNEQIKGISLQVDSKLEASALQLKDLETKETTKSEDSSEQPSKVIEDVANAATKVVENSASNKALLESQDSETLPPSSVPDIKDEVSKFAEEVVEDTEAMVEKARQAKEDATARAAIALEKAKTSGSRDFRWPWQKESANEKVSSENSTTNEQIEGVSSQVDSKFEALATLLEDSKSEGTTKSEDSLEEPLKVIEDATKAVSEVVENSASNEASFESRDSKMLPPPSVPDIEDEVSKFVEEVVEDTEAMVEKARQAKEDAATRAVIALEKAKTSASRGFRWPWQKESANKKVSSENSTTNEQIEGVSSQVDSKLEALATSLENSKTEGTIEKFEDSSNQTSSISNGLATPATEVAENAREAIDNTSISNVVRDNEEGSPTEPEEENNGAPLLSKKALEPDQEE